MYFSRPAVRVWGCWGQRLHWVWGGEVRSSQSFAHGSDRVSCLLDTCHCETLIWCDSEHQGLQLNGTHPEVAQRGGCWGGQRSAGDIVAWTSYVISQTTESGVSPPLSLSIMTQWSSQWIAATCGFSSTITTVDMKLNTMWHPLVKESYF